MTEITNGIEPAPVEPVDNAKVEQQNDEKKYDRAAAIDLEGEYLGKLNEHDKMIVEQGLQKFSRLGWKRLTLVLIVEAIALGALSIPGAFATLGMVPGVICSLGIGLIAIYTSYIVGEVKIKFPQIVHYPDVGKYMGGGRIGYEIIYVMLGLQLLLLVGNHCLTGTIAFENITESGMCSVVWGVVSMIILIGLAIPPSFADIAILGYIDFVSIIIAIFVTIIGTGVEASNSTGGLSGVNWSAWPPEDTTFTDAFIAITDICFAYSFAICQFSFMDEMHTPKDYKKSIWALGIIEIVIYTCTGGLVYAFVGQDVDSPALLSAGTLLSRVAFGIALPVIFISGSINTVVLGRLIHGRVFKNSTIRFINTKMGWITWLSLITVLTILAFIIAEIIPFFSDLLSITSALFISGFTFYFPAMMWFLLLKQGGWKENRNILLGVVNLIIFIMGLVILVGGTYSSVQDIIDNYATGSVRGVFTCALLT